MPAAPAWVIRKDLRATFETTAVGGSVDGGRVLYGPGLSAQLRRRALIGMSVNRRGLSAPSPAECLPRGWKAGKGGADPEAAAYPHTRS